MINLSNDILSLINSFDNKMNLGVLGLWENMSSC